MDQNIQEITNRVDSEIHKLLQNEETNYVMKPKDIKSVIIKIEIDKVCQTPRTHFPIVISLLSLLQILLHVNHITNGTQDKYSRLGQNLLFRTGGNRRQYWRYITYMLLHKDGWHLGLNTVFQLLAGIPLEIVHGSWRITIVYLAGVLGGSLGIEALSKCTALVGSSAGVYGIIGAHFSTLLLNWKETEDRSIRIFILFVYVLTDLFNWICKPQNLTDPNPSSCLLVSNLTNSAIVHFCGFVIGTLTAILVLKNIQERPWERKIQLISLILLVFVISFIICTIIISPDFNINDIIGTPGHNFNETTVS